ncbi:unnamed protein product [Cochlearia groenlandica]
MFSDKKDAKLRQKLKYDDVCEEIVQILARPFPQRLVLAGESGLGKTRLAKKIGQYVLDKEYCFLTLCLHLNKKFDSERSLYENIASQLSVYSDFEETEVDDRDEDEEEGKKPDELLSDLKKSIVQEILKKEKALSDKKKKEEKKAKEDEAKKKNVKNQVVKTQGETKEEEAKKVGAVLKPYLLLILDDEDNLTSEDKVMSKLDPSDEEKKKIIDEKILEFKKNNDDVEEIKKKIEENIKMLSLGFEKFLKDQDFLREDNSRIKIIVTRRKGDKEEEKKELITSGETESHDGTSVVQENQESSEEDKGEESNGDGSDDQDNSDNESDDQENQENSEEESDDQEDQENSEEESENQEEETAEIESEEEVVREASEKEEAKEDDAKGVAVSDAASTTAAAATAAATAATTTATAATTTAAAAAAAATTTAAAAAATTVDEPRGPTKIYEKIEFFTTDVSHVLINSIDEKTQRDVFLSLTSEDWKTDEDFIAKMVEISNKSPAAIAVLAKSLKEITRSGSNRKKEDVEELIESVLSADRLKPPSSESNINRILHLVYILLETYCPSKDIVLDCFWHSLDFFENSGCVYYRELITQWILEGYFDPVRSVEKAYQDGHTILMELINRGILKIQENNVVVPEMSMSNLIDPRRSGYLGRSRLRFSKVYVGDKKKGIGKITQIDDMIKTVQAKKGDKVTTILVSGDRLRRVTPIKYFEKLGDLEVLGLFEPTLDPFIKSFVVLVGLRVLIIRDCDLLDNIEELKALQGLNALEVSGASSLKTISGEFFKALSKLQSLHLSRLNITSSPWSISELTELHCLIIKDCPLLEDLPNIQELKKLEVVDVSGAKRLETCFDNKKGEKKDKSKNKNFYHLTMLQLLDFSESQIERLPIFQDSAEAKKPNSVKRLLLRDCSKLRRLPSLKPLSSLQILDLSGTTSLVEMLEVCFEDKNELKSLNLSRTNLRELATTINELINLTELLLKDATQLEVIPNIETLENLEVIDVSGCTKLKTIESSFEKMHYLREVDLSGTQVTTPVLPSLTKIKCTKHIVLADGRHFKGKDWDEVKKATSSNMIVKPQEEARKISERRLLQVNIQRSLYNTITVTSSAPKEVVEINESTNLDVEALATLEYVSFVDVSSTKLADIVNKTKSLKGCWIRMCIDVQELFSGVAEERLESLETLSITNLPSLEAVKSGGFKYLKKLSIDCCPKIHTVFAEGTNVKSSLEDLNVKHCEMFEKVVKDVELSSFDKLNWKVENCTSYKGPLQGLSTWVMVDTIQEASSQA